mmetsp:Transcript_722/g.1198  ORF Transcript_722/g.1198 Transcript_722/m.1198 type:complete len:357 (+) Transcript_722:60-1130(+)
MRTLLAHIIFTAVLCICYDAAAFTQSLIVNSARPPMTQLMMQHISRRQLMISTISSLSASAGLSQSALAAPPLTAEEADNFQARLERGLRAKPARVLRQRMNIDFAVLLMRSSYNAVDQLDIVAMDQFQKDFFLIRQAEYKYYSDALGVGAMQQGDLADPNYFDFISFAQYATISREIVNPPSVFEEQQPVEVGEDQPQKFDAVVVRRDPTIRNSDLPRIHTEIVGNSILDKLIEKFGETASAIPTIEPGSRPDAGTFLAAIKQMVNLFTLSGFAWEGGASMVQSGSSIKDTQFSIIFTSPATLWSGQSLAAKKAAVTNDFVLKTVKALATRAGYRVVNDSVNYKGNQEITTFSVL